MSVTLLLIVSRKVTEWKYDEMRCLGHRKGIQSQNM